MNQKNRIVIDYASDNRIKKYVHQKYVVKTGESDTDYIEKDRIVLESDISRQEYIDSFADDVGVLNILKKVQMTGDTTLLNQGKAVGGFTDLTKLPDNLTDAAQFVKNGVESFNSLDPELKQKMSIDEFVSKIGQAEFDAYIEKRIAALTAKKEVTEDGK